MRAHPYKGTRETECAFLVPSCRLLPAAAVVSWMLKTAAVHPVFLTRTAHAVRWAVPSTGLPSVALEAGWTPVARATARAGHLMWRALAATRHWMQQESAVRYAPSHH